MGEFATLSVLAKICANFFKSESWDDLIQQIVSAGIDLCQADRGTIFLTPDYKTPNKNNRVLTSLIATGVGGERLKIPLDKGIAGYVFRNQVALQIDDVAADSRFYDRIDEKTDYETKSLLAVPLISMGGMKLGVLELLNSKAGRFDETDLKTAQILGLYASMAIEQKFKMSSLQSRTSQLLSEKRKQFSQIEDTHFSHSKNYRLKAVFNDLPAYAESDSNVLICGESGTGKELMAMYLHRNSPRGEQPFITLNCAAIPESLFEAELFGVAKGAATGTLPRLGKIEAANEGTLFLDEIGEMPVSLQAKLLRVLQDKVVQKVGEEGQGRPVDFRIIAATNRDLKKMMSEGEFREDLYFRLCVLNILLPPLRERIEDFDDICETILNYLIKTRGWKLKSISAEAKNHLMRHAWPGNIRELQNRIESAYITSKGREVLEVGDFSLDYKRPSNSSSGEKLVGEDGEVLTLKEAKDQVEKDLVLLALQKCDDNRAEVSRQLGISREGLRKLLIRHGIPSGKKKLGVKKAA